MTFDLCVYVLVHIDIVQSSSRFIEAHRKKTGVSARPGSHQSGTLCVRACREHLQRVEKSASEMIRAIIPMPAACSTGVAFIAACVRSRDSSNVFSVLVLSRRRMQAAMNATPMEQAAYIGLLALAVSDALYCISARLNAGEFFFQDSTEVHNAGLDFGVFKLIGRTGFTF